MIKVEGFDLEGITPERLNYLSKEAIPKFPLFFFNSALRILNLGSIGYLMRSTRSTSSKSDSQDIIDPIEKADQVYRKYTRSKDPISFIVRAIRIFYATIVFLSLFNYINLKWYRFFLEDQKNQNKFLANQFYLKLERSRKLFFFGRLCFRKARKQKAKQRSLNELSLELKSISPKFHLCLTSEQDLFHKFTIRLLAIGAIAEVDEFKEAFNGFVGNQVNWYFDKESIIFMIESMNLKQKIRMTDRSKDISICFFNAKDGTPFDPDDLNTVASRKGLSKFNSQRFQEIINNPPKNDIPKIYSVYKEIYRS